MRANEMNRDELAAFLGTDDGRAFLDGIDAKWEEAIEPMREAGFIVIESDGSAMVSTYAVAVKACGLDAAASMLQMNSVEVPVSATETPAAAR